MNYFSGNRILYWIIAILGVFCLSLLAGIYVHYLKEKKLYEQRVQLEQQRHREIMHNLHLTPEQEKMFNSLRDKYFHDAGAVMEQLNAKRNEYIQVLTSENPDTTRLITISDEIGTLHRNLKVLTMRHYMELRGLCNADQKKVLNEIFSRFIQSEGRRRGPGAGKWQKGTSPVDCPWFKEN
ncbi:MAG TPA: periplasmic heavy metal sensor [Bacteroidales bacterium]|nr:periplasmic heavy metal sensor [Bacteroidales bacterium]